MNSSTKPEENNGSQREEQENEGRRQQQWNEFGYSFACLFMALLLFAAPWYFAVGDVFGSIAGLIFSLLCYIAGAVFMVFVLSFARSGFQAYPELRRLLPIRFLWGSEDAWDSAYGAGTLFFIAALIHGIAIGAFGMEGVISLIVKLAVYVFLFMGAVLFALSISGFIQLLLANLSRGDIDWDSLVWRVRRIGAIIGVVVGFAAALATIYDVLFNN